MSKLFAPRIILLLLLAVPAFLPSQVINTEQKRIFRKENGWYGNADLNFGVNRNTHRLLVAGSRVGAHYHKEKHTLLLLNDLALVKVDSNSIQNSGFQHVRYSYHVKKAFIPETFAQAQYNQVWKLDMRLLYGLGLRFQLLNNDSNRVFLGTLAMMEYEKVNHGAQINRNLRSSSYLSIALGIDKKVTFEHITYYQPLFRHPRDFRLSSDTSFRAAITKHMGFKTNFMFNFDSRPPDGLTRMFYSFQNGFSFRF